MDTQAQLLLCLLWLLYRICLQVITGDSAMGYWNLSCDIMVIFVLMTSGGFSQAVSRIILNAHARRDSVNEYGILRYALYSSLVFGAVSAILLYLLAPQICLLLYGKSLRAVSVSLRVMVPAVVCMSLSGVLRGYFHGIGTSRPARVSQFLFVLVCFISSLLARVLIRGEDAGYLAASGSFGILFGSFASVLFLFAVYAMYRDRIVWRAHKDMIHTENSFSVFLKGFLAGFRPFIMTTIGIAVFLLTDASLYGHLTGMKGYDPALISSLYGIFTGKYAVILCIPLFILITSMPHKTSGISTAYTHGDSFLLSFSMQRSICYAMCIAIPACVTAAIAGDAVTGFLFGDFTSITRKMFLAGAPLILFASYTAVTCFLLAGIDRLKTVLVNGLIAFAIHVLFLVILLYYSDMNIYAVTYSDTVFAFVLAAINTLTLIRHSAFRQEYIRSFLIPAGASAVMGAALFLIYHGLSGTSLPARLTAFVSLLLSVIIYIAALILFKGITQEEMREYPLGKAFSEIAVKLHLF